MLEVAGVDQGRESFVYFINQHLLSIVHVRVRRVSHVKASCACSYIIVYNVHLWHDDVLSRRASQSNGASYNGSRYSTAVRAEAARKPTSR